MLERTALEWNKALADLLKAISADGYVVNYDAEGCPPCNTIDDEDSCVGCPYRMRDMGVENYGAEDSA